MDEKTIVALLKGELEATFKELEQKPSEIEEALKEGEEPVGTEEETTPMSEEKVVNVVSRKSTSSRVRQSQLQVPAVSLPKIEVVTVEEFIEDTLMAVCSGVSFMDVGDVVAESVNILIGTRTLYVAVKGSYGDFAVPIGVISLLLRRVWQMATISPELMDWLEKNQIPEPTGEPEPESLECDERCPKRITAVIDYGQLFIAFSKPKECVVMVPSDVYLVFQQLRGLAENPEIEEMITKAGLSL